MNRRHGAGRLTLAAVAVAVLCGGCGVPSGSPAEPLATVPYGLLSPSATPSPEGASPAVRGPRVWLAHEGELVPVAAPPAEADPEVAAGTLLSRLASGPTDQQRAEGLSTALGPDVQLTLAALANGRAIVDVQAGDQAPSPGRLPLAVGQVVLTLTSLAGIDEVVLTVGGAPIEAPLPGGALTARPLRAGDYASLVAAPS